MNEDSIRQKLEEVDPDGKIPEGFIDEIVFSVVEQNKKSSNLSRSNNVEDLKNKLEETDDWRKKAAIFAKIISLGFD